MSLFPLFVNIEEKTFLIIGGGSVAAGKVKRLKQITNKIIVIAPQTKIEDVDIQILHRAFVREDLALGDYIVAATDDRALNAQIAAWCGELGKPVDVADDPALCTYTFPAFISKGELTVAISTNGTSPAYAKRLREQIEALIPEDIDAVLEEMAALREKLQCEVPDGKVRRKMLRDALDEKLI